MSQKTVLIITDGIGHKPNSKCNAFIDACTPTYDNLFATTPHTLISTHGLSVGLPVGQMGNSEVGHMTLGSGRILYQDLVKISKALENGTLTNNEVLKDILEKSNDIHLIGLMSDGGVHSHLEHIIGVAKIAQQNHKKVWLHLVTDGRDVDPHSASEYLKLVEKICDNTIKIATIGGRFYAMDRDNRWERVELGYAAIVNATPKTTLSEIEYINASYAKGETDEFIMPVAFGEYDGFGENDGVIMMNFRSDRAREITKAIGDEKFSEFDTKKLKLNIATMTAYDASFSYPIMFPKVNPVNTLSEVISRSGLRQMHTAETEKYAHVTFFFNGGAEEPLVGESRVLIPSPNVKTYDMQPEMSAAQVGKVVREAIIDGNDFVVVNFANGDMVGHTGNYEAAKVAVEVVDREIGMILAVAKENDYAVVITSDHGNCEEMCSIDGKRLTNHTVGEVWAFVICDCKIEPKSGMGLNNIAATVLTLMGLEIPSEMDKALI